MQKTFTFILIIFSSSLVFAQQSFLDNFYSIHELNQKKLTFGAYHTEGFVVKKYTCPPCPKEALCKPCAPDNILISEKKIERETCNDLTEKDLIVFVDNAKRYRLGRKYRFLIKMTDVRTTGQAANNVKLIYSERIR